ncbi:hypothetical protein [Endozoicomonas ascidiicola]|uniref:hypothetical protein n=1 Tax=Endozoicomonas ascidiicola TaxID=1698521 RepID=UPI00083248CD|nr:hypothetical protein [Endozoicomonas ascidiicola]
MKAMTIMTRSASQAQTMGKLSCAQAEPDTTQKNYKPKLFSGKKTSKANQKLVSLKPKKSKELNAPEYYKRNLHARKAVTKHVKFDDKHTTIRGVNLFSGEVSSTEVLELKELRTSFKYRHPAAFQLLCQQNTVFRFIKDTLPEKTLSSLTNKTSRQAMNILIKSEFFTKPQLSEIRFILGNELHSSPYW